MSAWFREAYFPEGRRTLAELQGRARLDDRAAEAFLGVSRSTFSRWRRNGNPPEWARLLLAIRGGHMPWEQWDGWYLTPQGLVAPGQVGQPYTPGEILALPWLHGELAELRRFYRAFRSLADQEGGTLPDASRLSRLIEPRRCK